MAPSADDRPQSGSHDVAEEDDEADRPDEGEGAQEDADRASAPSRPVPVRAAMEAEREEPDPIEPPSAIVEVDGNRWLVRVEGRARAGHPSDVGASLLFLTAARASEPEERLREATVVARRLEDFAPEELADVVRKAASYRSSWEPEELFPGTRRHRSR